MNPLSMKQVSNSQSAISGSDGYTGFNIEEQFDISSLALNLQAAMSVDKSQRTFTKGWNANVTYLFVIWFLVHSNEMV